MANIIPSLSEAYIPLLLARTNVFVFRTNVFAFSLDFSSFPCYDLERMFYCPGGDVEQGRHPPTGSGWGRMAANMRLHLAVLV